MEIDNYNRLRARIKHQRLLELGIIFYRTHPLVLVPPGCCLGTLELGAAALCVAAAAALDDAVDLPRFFT